MVPAIPNVAGIPLTDHRLAIVDVVGAEPDNAGGGHMVRVDQTAGYVVADFRPSQFAEDDRIAFARLLRAGPAMLQALVAASHALRSYQYGNASTDLAEGIADSCDAAIRAACEGA